MRVRFGIVIGGRRAVGHRTFPRSRAGVSEQGFDQRGLPAVMRSYKRHVSYACGGRCSHLISPPGAVEFIRPSRRSGETRGCAQFDAARARPCQRARSGARKREKSAHACHRDAARERDLPLGAGRRFDDRHAFVVHPPGRLPAALCVVRYPIRARGKRRGRNGPRCADVRAVVITGGEPLAQDVGALVATLRDKHVTIETSGTIFADLPQVALFSISPKVGSSGYTPKPATLRKFCAAAPGRMQLKFVIADDRDYEEALASVRGLGDALPPATPVILQPESSRAGRGERYAETLRTLTEKALADGRWSAFDIRVLPQLHYILWGGEPGR